MICNDIISIIWHAMYESIAADILMELVFAEICF